MHKYRLAINEGGVNSESKLKDAKIKFLLMTSSLIACSVGLAHAGGGHFHAAQQSDAVVSPADDNKVSSFDILAAHVHSNERSVTFHMTTAGKAGHPPINGTFWWISGVVLCLADQFGPIRRWI